MQLLLSTRMNCSPATVMPGKLVYCAPYRFCSGFRHTQNPWLITTSKTELFVLACYGATDMSFLETHSFSQFLLCPYIGMVMFLALDDLGVVGILS